MIMEMKFKAAAAATALALVFGAPAANAATISSGGFSAAEGQSLLVQFSCPAGTECRPGSGPFTADLSALMTLKLSAYDSDTNTWNIDVSVQNTSTDPDGDARVTAVAFNTSPDIISGSIDGIVWDYKTDNFPGFSTEFCGTTTPNCASAQNNADNVKIGQTGFFTMNLTAESGPNLNFDQFFVRFASIGATDGSTTFTGAAIPLPAAGWLLLTALGGLGAAGLRRRRKDA